MINSAPASPPAISSAWPAGFHPGGAPTEAAVRTVGLRKTYPDGTTAVHDLDLEIRQGEVFALLGPNGAGKSTTVGMLTTSVLPSAGQAQVAGVDVIRRPAIARRGIGVVPQRNTLDRSLSVRDNLIFHGRFFGLRTAEARIEADRRLEQVALTAAAGKAVDALSGGMAQRLMIARAVLHRPAVLFLDEPTTGLDPQSRLAVHEIVRDLQAAGQTIVLITHDMLEADQLADRVAIIDHGRLLALDTPAALKRSMDADTVVSVASDADPAALAALLTREIPGVGDHHLRSDSVLLTVRGSDHLFTSISSAATDAGLTLRDIRIEDPSLETVFIQLTGKDLRD
ncbi:MAG TPA: ATP-binding cassette domain-containing protein [Kineosporiaceae bacterium]|nr:ATP-binding cassette domain-containing protein [Kineosporiaceae bacterium]